MFEDKNMQDWIRTSVGMAADALKSLEEGVDADGANDESQEDSELDEGVSQAILDRLVDAMFYSPRVENIMAKIGLDTSKLTDLRMQITPLLKTFLASNNIKVAGGAQARTALKSIAKGV